MDAAIKTFFRSVEQTVGTCDMFRPGDAVLVGVSGGPDSVALLHVLRHLAERFNLHLGMAHLNHCLRPKDAGRDEAFVSALAHELSLPCHIERCNVNEYRHHHKLSLEEAGREVRYAFLERIAKCHRYSKIALGHHADDNAELILMCLLRGSGPLGLSGMRPVRAGRIVRPLLRVTRSDILRFLAFKKATYVCDDSNNDPCFTRNRIRSHLIPEIRKHYNPGIVDALNRLGMISEAEEAWIAQIISPVFDSMVRFNGDQLLVSVEPLKAHHLAVQRRLLRRAVETLKGDLRRISLAHIDAVIDELNKGKSGNWLTLPDGIRICFTSRQLRMMKTAKGQRAVGSNLKPEAAGPFEYRVKREKIDSTPFDCDIFEIGMTLRFFQSGPVSMAAVREAGHECAFFDMKKLQFPLTLRNFRPGDRFVPLGMKGHQKVKDFFINRKVPQGHRIRCPLLLSGDRIIWVAGHQIDDAVKVESLTRDVLNVELLTANSRK